MRRLRPGEIDHELIWLAATVLAASAGLIWLSFNLPWPRCTFRTLFGIPCLTCGATRAALSFSHGDVARAFRFNPLAALGFCGVVAFDLYAIAVLVAGVPRVRVRGMDKKQSRAIGLLIVAAVLVNWVYLLRTL